MWKELRRDKRVRNIMTALAVIGSALLQTYVIQAFIRPAGLLSGGFTGIAILIDRITSLFGFNISTSLGMIVLNIPVACACSKSISRRFTFFSLMQVLLASTFLRVFHFTPIFDDGILNVIYGGVLYGFAIVLALRGNASTGGTDFIALYVSNKTGNSIWTYVFVGNVILLCIFGAIFGWDYAGYSILFQFVSTKVISTFHHRYERVTLQITTVKGPELAGKYVEDFRHGISCVDAVGGYSRKKMYLLHTVVSSYEVEDIIALFHEVDDHVIVNMFKTQQFYGRFYRAPME
ncbi:YitT family protein [Lacrimispora defluvii]|uniref:YitT family protein n=1 Tax=Lacrimispora defluvii TaxID=2719233 RepID=A0ABX1VJN7_9FIRM|nr:YitT family protein [Lacrimispora defluvii]NNJ28468.1 YitT family protein [Lacrimispora defluvii]